MEKVMESEKILQMKSCEELFSQDPEQAKREYYQLAKQFHPDVNHAADANEVYVHINLLYQQARDRFSSGIWLTPTVFQFTDSNEKNFCFRYRASYDFELGTVFWGSTHVLYRLNSGTQKYVQNASAVIKKFIYRDDAMRREMRYSLPQIESEHHMRNGDTVLLLKKEQDEYPLINVLKCYPDGMQEQYVAWIISRLCAICCYLEASAVTHNGIDLNSCAINTKKHTLRLVGGWWYSTPQGAKMLGTTSEIFALMPPKAKSEKMGDIQTDLEAVKYMAQQLLKGGAVSAGISKWLNKGSGSSAFTEFTAWNKALDKAFGSKRVFKVMNISESDVYQ